MSAHVICLDDNGDDISLTIGKVYRTLPDEKAAARSMIRVIDDTFGEAGSEDGYLYLAPMFEPIEVSDTAARVLESPRPPRPGGDATGRPDGTGQAG